MRKIKTAICKKECRFIKKIENIFVNRGFNITIRFYNCKEDEYFVELEKYTDSGEDWIESFWFDGTLKGLAKSITENYENFDVDEDVRIWAESAGKNGTPSFKVLVENAESKEKELKEMSEELENLYNENE